jgi:flagellar motor switch protein FliN/FliY
LPLKRIHTRLKAELHWLDLSGMPAPLPEHAAQIADACRANLEGVMESLNLCFDFQQTVRVGEPGTWASATAAELDGPGLLVGMQVEGSAIVVALPAGIGLPDWYRQPNESQSARLNTLPMEWSLSLLPAEFEVERFAAHSCDNLREAIATCAPAADAAALPLLTGAEGADAPSLWMVWPVAQLPADAAAPVPEEETPSSEVEPEGDPVASAAAVPAERVEKIRHLMKLPVPIIVKLAEKRIQLGQLLGLGPGAIVTFEKSCEGLLDLCVNNKVYCRGEAVKIGEKFGLKVNEFATLEERREALR